MKKLTFKFSLSLETTFIVRTAQPDLKKVDCLIFGGCALKRVSSDFVPQLSNLKNSMASFLTLVDVCRVRNFSKNNV